MIGIGIGLSPSITSSKGVGVLSLTSKSGRSLTSKTGSTLEKKA